MHTNAYTIRLLAFLKGILIKVLFILIINFYYLKTYLVSYSYNSSKKKLKIAAGIEVAFIRKLSIELVQQVA